MRHAVVGRITEEMRIVAEYEGVAPGSYTKTSPPEVL
jgi:thiamine biosynthesis protein ThiC